MKQNSMLAMILAGGRGSRLHDLTNKVAKLSVGPWLHHSSKINIFSIKVILKRS